MIDAQQGVGLNELGLGGGGPDGHQGLAGEARRPLGHCPDVPGKPEMAQVIQEVLLEQVLAPQVVDVLLAEVQILDVLYQLLQPRRNGEAALVGHPAEENVEVGDALLHPLAEVAVGHGHLIEVEQHGQVQSLLALHKNVPRFLL